MKTNDFNDIRFYHGTADNNPLENIPDFDRNNFWSIDGTSLDPNDGELEDFYERDDVDDSFFLIPKGDVLKVWFVSYDDDDTYAPKRIGMMPWN